MRVRRYGDLPIKFKLLAPFAILMIVWGGFGSYVLARGAAGEARGRATAALASSLSGVRSAVGDAERALLESVRLAANTQGVAASINRRDRAALERLLLPLVANSQDLTIDVVDRGGDRLAHLRIEDGSIERTGPPGAAPAGAVRAARGARDEWGDKWSGLSAGSLYVAGPVRDARQRAVGAVIVARSFAALVDGEDAVAIFDAEGMPLVATGALPYRPTEDGLRETSEVDGEPYELLHGPLEVRGEIIGSIVVGIPSAVALGSSYATARMLALLVGLAVLAAVIIGLWTARAITGPLSRLMAATEALERGRLDARAEVHGRDEVGHLATSFNRMAAELQASHAELEAKVAARTAELEQANSELAAASEAKSKFLASMSHELRTPLNAIIGFADILGDPQFGPVRAGETRELASNILTSGRHLLTLINDVLDLAKIEAGKIEVSPEPADVGSLIGEVLAVVRPLADGKRHAITIAGDMSIPRVFADPGRTRQILFNLVANAIKYTPDGGRITVGVEPTGDDVRLWVRDTGPGLTRREAERLFEPFERGKAARTVEGAGLGLALARHLVEAQGGRIWAEGRPGKGATFSFTLPAARTVDRKVTVDV